MARLRGQLGVEVNLEDQIRRLADARAEEVATPEGSERTAEAGPAAGSSLPPRQP
ncbi:MAG: hypothetical protein R2695_09810 [Acidimicrobiales bacterium]